MCEYHNDNHMNACKGLWPMKRLINFWILNLIRHVYFTDHMHITRFYSASEVTGKNMGIASIRWKYNDIKIKQNKFMCTSYTVYCCFIIIILNGAPCTRYINRYISVPFHFSSTLQWNIYHWQWSAFLELFVIIHTSYIISFEKGYIDYSPICYIIYQWWSTSYTTQHELLGAIECYSIIAL